MFGIPANWLAGIGLLLVGLPLVAMSDKIVAAFKSLRGKASTLNMADFIELVDDDGGSEIDENALDSAAADRLQARYSKRGPEAREALQKALQHYFDPVVKSTVEDPTSRAIAAAQAVIDQARAQTAS